MKPMITQLRTNPVNRKKARRDMERSSRTVREDAKMERRTAGVTARCRFSPFTVLPVVVVVPASLPGALRNVGRGVPDDDEAIF